VQTPGAWIVQTRTALGLSTRELAHLAGVAYPTVSRIERGHTDPRWGTVADLARSLGFELEMGALTPIAVVRLADLVDAIGDDGTPDWTRLRAFADQLRRRPHLSGVATSAVPAPSGSPLLDNLLAGVAEIVADDAGLRRPRWTREIPPLVEAWEAPGTPRKRQENASSAAPQFAARNILLSATAIWRASAPAHERAAGMRRRGGS
jgi:transcriptional regulator with XRE-family HTH domain